MDVQCYDLFGGIALENHAFSFTISHPDWKKVEAEVKYL